MSTFLSTMLARLAAAAAALALVTGCTSEGPEPLAAPASGEEAVGQVIQAACPVGQCDIGGLCYNDGTDSPTNACNYCNIATSALAWSTKTTAQCTAGLTGVYYPNRTLTAPSSYTRVDPGVNFGWGNASPGAPIGTDNYSVEWTGQVLTDYSGNYTFETETDDGVRLWVNGVQLVDKWVDQGAIKWSGTLNLTANTRYDVRMQYYENGGGAVAYLRWTHASVPYAVIPADHLYAASATCTGCDDGESCTTDVCNAAGACVHTAVTNGTACGGGTCQSGSCCASASCVAGLTGDYFNNLTLTGPATLTRVDATVNYDWGGGSPGAGVNTDNFSTRWTGQVLADYAGVYTFETETDDGVRLWVNGVLLVDKWVNQGPTKWSGTITLAAATRYDIKIEYFDSGGGASAKLRWSHASVPYAVIPSDHLFSATAPCLGCLNGTACVPFASETATMCGVAGSACASCDDGNACTVDACDGTGTCQHLAGNAGTVCRAAIGTCDTAETCTGSSSTCPPDVVAVAGTVCRASAGVCDVAESCNGTAGACPANGYVTIATACANDGNACTDDMCSGASAACTHPVKASCSNGLSVTYYDNQNFSGATAHRIDPDVDFDFGNGSPDGAIGSDSFSARWTGQVLADYTDTYTFEAEGDDGVRLWVNDVLLADGWRDQGPTKYSGTIALVAGQRYDIKLDYYDGGGGASVRLRWQNAGGTVPYAIIPTDHLFAGGDVDTAGMAWTNGANNGTGDPFQVWRTSKTPNVVPVNATPESANNWGLGDAVMMVPAFSPNGRKLVFIDGDDGGGAGWRKGLSMWDFDQSGMVFTNRTTIRNTWPSGDVMKWPVWEPDSRSVVFQTSTPTELCNTCGTRYGNMAPTNYYGTVGKFWSIDSTGPGTAVELTRLNTGERTADANKAYQPTMLPVAAGGYRWIVFTSTRPYGNALNPPGISRSCTASQLWVSAIDDSTSGGADRSHPAFWLPNQNLGDPSASASYINERGYWVLDPCKAAGTGPASECTSNDDCCGAPATAACRIDQPATVPPTRHCVAVNSAVCSADGGTCSIDADCCGAPQSHCIGGVCLPPAPIPNYQDALYTREYEATCPPSTSPVWRFFDWQSVTPGDSAIEFTAQTSTASTDLDTATPVLFGTAAGPPTTGWIGADVGLALSDAGQMSQRFLRVTMTLKASSDNASTPTLTSWRQSYSCLPSR